MRLVLTRLTLDQASQVRVLDAQVLIPVEPGCHDGRLGDVISGAAGMTSRIESQENGARRRREQVPAAASS
jgi:hypothetical protein